MKGIQVFGAEGIWYEGGIFKILGHEQKARCPVSKKTWSIKDNFMEV